MKNVKSLVPKTLIPKIEEELNNDKDSIQLVKDEIKALNSKITILSKSKSTSLIEIKQQELQAYIIELKNLEEHFAKWNRIKQELIEQNNNSGFYLF